MAEIRRGKRRKKKKKPQHENALFHSATTKKPQSKNIMSASAMQGGHKQTSAAWRINE